MTFEIVGEIEQIETIATGSGVKIGAFLNKTHGRGRWLPDGHTGWVEEDTELVEFSPQNEMDATLSHIRAQVGS